MLLGLLRGLPRRKRVPKMFQHVPRCANMFQGSKRFQLVPRCSNLFQHVPKSSKVFQDVPRCSNVLQGVPRCSKYFQEADMTVPLTNRPTGKSGPCLERLPDCAPAASMVVISDFHISLFLRPTAVPLGQRLTIQEQYWKIKKKKKKNLFPCFFGKKFFFLYFFAFSFSFFFPHRPLLSYSLCHSLPPPALSQDHSPFIQSLTFIKETPLLFFFFYFLVSSPSSSSLVPHHPLNAGRLVSIGIRLFYPSPSHSDSVVRLGWSFFSFSFGRDLPPLTFLFSLFPLSFHFFCQNLFGIFSLSFR